MSDSENDHWKGTVWSNNPGRGTIYDNNPFRDTVLDNRNDVRQPEQIKLFNETHVQRVERERLERQGIYPNSPNNKGRGGFGIFGIAVFLVLFTSGVMFIFAILSGLVHSATAGNEVLRYHLTNWLSHTLFVFLTISTLILFISLLVRRYWAGTMLVIATGILSFIGTGIYLVISGIFFGK